MRLSRARGPFAARRRHRRRARRGQAMTEVIILVAAVLVAIAWTTYTFPEAISKNYTQSRDVLLAPF